MEQVAVIYSSYDGVLNSYCGVGIATRTFVKSFPLVKKYYLKFGIDLVFHLITPALVANSLGYDEKILEESLLISGESGGKVHFVTNGSNGMIPYGNNDNWLAVSHTTASKVLEISQNYTRNIFFAVDTPFALSPHLVELQKSAFNIKDIVSVLVLHSDCLVHRSSSLPVNRLGWEASAVKGACLESNIRIASTSKFFQKHLIKNYGIPKNIFVDLQTGIFLGSERYCRAAEEEIVKDLKKYNIPLNKDLVFSVGRAESYKGFDLLIKAMAKIKKQAHLVFIASPYKTEDSIVAELQDLLKTVNISSTPIFNLDFNLPRLICQWPKTKIVAQLSRCEPFGLVPEEVRIWARHKGPVILASRKDGYIEQITDGVDGFLVNIGNITTVSQKIDAILDMSDAQLEEIKRNGHERLLNNYDFRISLFECLRSLLKLEINKKDFIDFLKQ